MNEAIRMLNICNACRYCEGHCAVFPALERRLELNRRDLEALAHLCHQCGACFHNCQYAPPHEFAVNLPKTLASEQQASFARHNRAAGLLVRYPVTTATVSVLAATLLFVFAVHEQSGLFQRTENFYDLLSHSVMAITFSVIGLMIPGSWLVVTIRYWKTLRLPAPWNIHPRAWWQATTHAVKLKNLDGGHGSGCPVENDEPGLAKRTCHHWVVVGFLLCFAATASGTLLHYVYSLPAPYDWLSLPKFFGVTGGIALSYGCIGLLRISYQTDPATQHQPGFSRVLTWLLLLVALSGLALPLLKGTAWLGISLAVHLGLVSGLFLNLAIGKFLHSLFRYLALIADAQEKAGTR